MGEAAPKQGSMEEILASIRQIINSDDASAGGKADKPAAAAPSHRAPGGSAPTPLRPGGYQPKPETLRPASRPAGELLKPGGLEPDGPKSGDPKPNDLRRNNAKESNSKESDPKAGGLKPGEGKPAAVAAAPAQSIRPASAPARPDPTSVAVTPAALKPLPDSQQRAADRSAPAGAGERAAAAKPPAGDTVQKKGFHTPVREVADEKKSPAPAGRSEADEFREALLSPSTAGAVSDSITRLREALTENQQAQVEAVLRPMLREWLDDNLPGLVERLVREEIRRISDATTS